MSLHSVHPTGGFLAGNVQVEFKQSDVQRRRWEREVGEGGNLPLLSGHVPPKKRMT